MKILSFILKNVKRKYVRGLLTLSVVSGVFILGGMALQSTSINNKEHQRYIRAIAQQEARENYLTKNILRIRYQELEDYDLLVESLEWFETNQGMLSEIPGFIGGREQSAISQILQTKFKTFQKLEIEIEEFKSKNALLKNSLKYLPELKSELVNRETSTQENLALVKALNQLQEQILLYNLNADRDLANKIQETQNQIEKIKAENDFARAESLLDLVLRHTEIVLNLQPQVNQLTEELLRHSDITLTKELQEAYLGAYQKAVRRLTIYRAIAYLFLLLILSWIAYRIIKNLSEANYRVRRSNLRLEATLKKLKETQAKLIQTEKMAGLGQVVAGVAHEINNPVSFIYSNLTPAQQYLQDLLELIEVYQQEYPQRNDRIEDVQDAIDLDFVRTDFLKLLGSMNTGAERIRTIVLSLRNFSRFDESELKTVNIHEGIDSALVFLNERLTHNRTQSTIQVVKNYGDLPLITCFPGQLNQVFVNILSNAIDALHAEEIYERTLTITTEIIRRTPQKFPTLTEIPFEENDNSQEVHGDVVAICIQDTGLGIPKKLQDRIFEPFFTTKPIGEGTGLGLSVSYQIVVEKHQGVLKCISTPEEGTTFRIEIPLHPGKRRNSEPKQGEISSRKLLLDRDSETVDSKSSIVQMFFKEARKLKS
ncbi:hypothetical protein IQ249_12780 [Lusitaniella coriacea LEGE 07157]|uniref:histidine kinase n=1 Tax=Lusitaniella coriacea LEGE 07157 TaxID=945747 RepID=A0A8J7JBC0_9CYAN|nr:DAHL domain-containing protein [Lusitaniella coriacea]MBE9116775.1 hypothetical protein [Lusitaniella coriacea LEGE 07157]